MILVTRLNGSKIMINCDFIEMIEETPDTIVTLSNGKKYVVSESMRELEQLVVKYKRKIFIDYKNDKE